MSRDSITNQAGNKWMTYLGRLAIVAFLGHAVNPLINIWQLMKQIDIYEIY